MERMSVGTTKQHHIGALSYAIRIFKPKNIELTNNITTVVVVGVLTKDIGWQRKESHIDQKPLPVKVSRNGTEAHAQAQCVAKRKTGGT